MMTGKDDNNVNDNDNDDGIDEETINLFAIMDSTMAELQIEMELLESKEYIIENNDSTVIANFNKNDKNKNNNGTDKKEKEDRYLPRLQLGSKDDNTEEVEDAVNYSPPPSTGIGIGVTTEVSSSSSSSYFDGDDGDSDELDEMNMMGKTLSLPNNIKWDKIEPAAMGDPDYVPIADYTATAITTTKAT